MASIHLQNPITTVGNSILSNTTTSTGTFTTTPYSQQPWITTTTPNPYWGVTNINSGSWAQPEPINPLTNLSYSIDFDIDDKELLEDNIKGIRKNNFLFWCKYEGNRIQPYELIMKLIREKTKFTVTVNVSDVLSIKYIDAQFIEIENNLNFDAECDFSVLKVKFKYEKILSQNQKLSTKELRMDKLKKIQEVEE